MAIRYLETATVYFVGADVEKKFPSLDAALNYAAAHVGNWSYNKPWPNEDLYLFGPGNGDTSVTVRRDVEFHYPKKEQSDA
jgi:hypothetical protein